MTLEQTRDNILEIGIVPVVRAASFAEAMLAVEAVCAGGIPVVEVTMTIPGAIEVIAELAKTAGPEMVIGAGTVLNVNTAQRCIDAGAEFIVSPGFNPTVVSLTKQSGKLMMAGALTPTEVMAAWEAGSDLVKIFPCGSVGAASYLKALKTPLPHVAMVPTGGVNLETAADFIRAGADALGVGGELIFPGALKSGDTSSIANAARQYVAIVHDARRAVRADLQHALAS